MSDHILGEVIAELDRYEFGGITDDVKHQVIRDLVAQNKQLRRESKALGSFVHAFEDDFVMGETIVDKPNRRWGVLEDLYWEAKTAVAPEKDSENS